MCDKVSKPCQRPESGRNQNNEERIYAGGLSEVWKDEWRLNETELSWDTGMRLPKQLASQLNWQPGFLLAKCPQVWGLRDYGVFEF